jgi:hypothetical protein
LQGSASAQVLVSSLVGVQVPETQASSVQSLLSVQVFVSSFELTHPLPTSQESSVQSLESSQSRAVPGWQPLTGSQVSVPLQALASSQTTGVPVQDPAEHASLVVQALASSQTPTSN